MPIRFRCAYCNQLMGIATRKAGNVVTCPKCAGQVVVPTPDPSQIEEERQAGNPAAAFEEDEEVQKLLEYAEESKPAETARASPARSTSGPATAGAPRSVPQSVTTPAYVAEIDVVPLSNGSLPPLIPARGIYLTPGVLTIMLVLVGLLIGLGFFLGFLLGRSTVG